MSVGLDVIGEEKYLVLLPGIEPQTVQLIP
jgi:hypothetical protein